MIDEMMAALEMVGRVFVHLPVGLVVIGGSLLLKEQLGSGRRRDVRVDEAVGSLADPHPFEHVVEGGQFRLAQRVGDVAQLVRINPHVVVGDESRYEFAIERVVRRVQRPHAPVRIVVGVHADAEGAFTPQRRRPPVVVVMAEAVHLLMTALVVVAVSLGHGPLATQLLLTPFRPLLLDLPSMSLTSKTLLYPRLRPRPVDIDARAQSNGSRPLRPTNDKDKRGI